MKDRSVEFPNRYRLTKVAGTDDIYDLVPAPGDVTEEGTYINKATLLKDTTAALFGLDNKAVPDDVFNALATCKANNPNLLDNWYFADPIDQRGGYVVLGGTNFYSDAELKNLAGTLSENDHYDAHWLNTTGATYGYFYGRDGVRYYVALADVKRGYVDGNYTIDRWKKWVADCITVTSNGLRIEKTKADNGLFQYFENGSEFIGKDLTASVLLSDGSFYSGTLTSEQTISTDGWAVYCETPFGSLRQWFGEGASFCIWQKIGTDITLTAAKLELGSVQTLAHKDENGNWVLNDPPPNKTLELAKCQRYYQLFYRYDRMPVHLADYRPAMRTTPATGSFEVGGVTYWYADAEL